MTSALNKRDEDRAAKKQRLQARQPVTVQSEFINRELSKEETDTYRTWREDFDVVFDLWRELLEEGYRVNTKYDDYSSSCAAFLIPDTQSENYGYILTGRGGNPYRAVSEALFKHGALFGGIWLHTPVGRVSSEDPDF